jgi:flavin-dependent dehydrogenase
VTGFAAVGDAWACTNPSEARGISVGMVHTQLLRRIVRGYHGDPAGFAQAWDEGTEHQVAPFYRNQVQADHARLAEMTALRNGRQWSPADSALRQLASAAPYDAGLFRAYVETLMCLALPQDVIRRPGIREKTEQPAHQPPPPAPGPDRQQLLQILNT